MSGSSHASVERILHRLCREHGGALTTGGAHHWKLLLHADEESDALRFDVRYSPASGEVTDDAEVHRFTTAQAVRLTRFQAGLASAIEHERVTFATPEEVLEYFRTTDGEVDEHLEDGYLVLDASTDLPVAVTFPTVSNEPWVEVSVPFLPDVDPGWLLEKNGLLTCARFEIDDDGEVSLSSSLPLVMVTGQRLFEMMDDLVRYREILLEEWSDDEDEDEDEGEPEEEDLDEEEEVPRSEDRDSEEGQAWDEPTAIVGPWSDEIACSRALIESLAAIGAVKLATRTDGCSIASVHRIGDARWISGSSDLVAALAPKLQSPRLFGVVTIRDSSGRRATGVKLWSLRLDPEGLLVRRLKVGDETEDLDAAEASRRWETWLAARSMNVPPSQTPPRLVFYRDTA